MTICSLKRIVKRILSRKQKNIEKSILGKDVMLASCRVICSRIADYVNVTEKVLIRDSCIGKRTSIGHYSEILNSEIGSYCSISYYVTIGAQNHPINHLSGHAFYFQERFGISNETKENIQEKCIVGNDVWIGCKAIVLAGVHIGDGAVIGAGAVVTKDVPPFAIVAGVPAKIIKYRFDENIITTISDIKWWNWDDDKLKSNLELFRHPLDNEILSKLLEIKERI